MNRIKKSARVSILIFFVLWGLTLGIFGGTFIHVFSDPGRERFSKFQKGSTDSFITVGLDNEMKNKINIPFIFTYFFYTEPLPIRIILFQRIDWRPTSVTIVEFLIDNENVLQSPIVSNDEFTSNIEGVHCLNFPLGRLLPNRNRIEVTISGFVSDSKSEKVKRFKETLNLRLKSETGFTFGWLKYFYYDLF